MTYADLIAHFGTLTNAATALGLSVQRVHNWQKRGIPEPWQEVIRLRYPPRRQTSKPTRRKAA